MANVALIFSGQYVKYVSGLRSGLPVGECEYTWVGEKLIYSPSLSMVYAIVRNVFVRTVVLAV